MITGRVPVLVSACEATPATARELARVWRGLDRDDIFPVSMAALVGGLCGHRDHTVPDRAFRGLIDRYVQFEDITEAAVPLHLVAFDLNNGHEVLLSEGPAIDAVAASASIPGVFPPVRIAERVLIDGGVVNNTPISHAVELGAERIYVLRTQGCDRTLARAPKGALDVAIHGLSMLIDGRLDADLARYSTEAELIVLPASNRSNVQPTSFDHTSRLIGEAFADARALLTGADGPSPVVARTEDPIAA